MVVAKKRRSNVPYIVGGAGLGAVGYAMYQSSKGGVPAAKIAEQLMAGEPGADAIKRAAEYIGGVEIGKRTGFLYGEAPRALSEKAAADLGNLVSVSARELGLSATQPITEWGAIEAYLRRKPKQLKLNTNKETRGLL